jgi:hypothetical protein
LIPSDVVMNPLFTATGFISAALAQATDATLQRIGRVVLTIDL